MILASTSTPPTRTLFRALLGAAVTLVSMGVAAVPRSAAAATGELRPNGRIVYGDAHDIRSIGPDGRGVTRLSESTAYEREPQVSPDGTKIAYFNDGDIAVMNIDGSEQHRLTNVGPVYTYRTDIQWSPDGTTLAYLVLNKHTDMKLYTIPAAGGERRLVSVGITNVERWGYAWSPDSTRLAFVAYRVYVGAADGSGVEPITMHDDVDGSFGVDWSPDGSTIAYTREGDIWTIHPDGSGDTLLVSASRDPYTPQWSPTGEQLMYLALGLDAPGSVGVVDADGQNDHLMGAGAWNASWSPDGTSIVYEGVQDQRYGEIYTVSATGGTPTRLTFNKTDDHDPDWAPGCSITGTPGPDVLEGTPERDFICGGTGRDVISGLGGDDVLLGGFGPDTIVGGLGNDVMAGERGRDELWGGHGDDTVNGRDGLSGERLAAGRGSDRCRRDASDVLVACETIDRDLERANP